MMKYIYTKSFYLGLGIGVAITLLTGFLVLNKNGFFKVAGLDASSPSLPQTTLYKVIPQTAKTGDKVVIRGNRFNEKGIICFGSCDTQFEIISWSSGAVVARVTSGEGQGDLWVVDGKGTPSTKVKFSVESR